MEVSIGGRGAFSQVSIDDFDLTKYARAFTLRHMAGEVPVLTVEIPAITIDSFLHDCKIVLLVPIDTPDEKMKAYLVEKIEAAK